MKKFIMGALPAVLVACVYLGSAHAEDVCRRVLDNGLVLLVREAHKTPLVAIEAQVKTGSASEEGYWGSGISHFVEHMLFKGTARWPRPGDIEQEVKSLGGYINGFTSYDQTGVHLVVPASCARQGLEIVEDILTDALFDPVETEKERGVILKEMRLNIDDPGRYLSLVLWSNMFKVHPYRFPPIGYENLFNRLTRDDLVAYYKRWYTPDNMVVAVVGDIDQDGIIQTAQQTLGRIPRGYPASTVVRQEPPQRAEIVVDEERELHIGYCAIGFHSVGIREKDIYSLDVLSMILGSGEDSRLSRGLYRQKKIVYSVESSNYTPRDPGVFVITAVLEPANVNAVITGVWAEIEGVKAGSITDAELTKAKNNTLSSYIFSRQTVESEASDLASGEVMAGDWAFSRKYVEGIRAVTKESVTQAAQRYLMKEGATVVTLLPRRQAHKGVAVKDTQPFTYRIEKYLLNNDLKVLLIEDHSLPIVTMNLIGLGGLRTETFDNNGISNLVSRVLVCGTKRQTEDEIFSKIESAGAAIDSFSGSNAFGLTASSLTKDGVMTLETIADVWSNPAFAPDKIEREKAAAEAAVKAADDNIYQTGMRTLKYLLFRRHPYRYQAAGRIPSIRKLTRNALADYYRFFYRPSNTVLTVSGDIDKPQIKEKVRQLFGLIARAPAPMIARRQEHTRARPRSVVRKIEKGQSLVLLGYLGTRVDSHDAYSLDVLCCVLSGINGRLANLVREKKGISYALDVKSVPGIERGMIIFYIGTTKEHIAVAREELLKAIEGVQRDGVTSEELRYAKRELAGLHTISLQRIQDVSMQAALGELFGLGYDDFLKYEERVRHITRECVVRAARKYLDPHSYILVVVEGTKGAAS